MYIINIIAAFSLLFVNLPEAFCQVDGCYHETFDDSISSGISSRCTEFNNVTTWTFDTYDNADVAIPGTSTSNGFIMVHEEGQHCVSNNDVLKAVDGSEMQISYFASGVANIVVMLTNVLSKSIVDSVFVPIVYDDWTTYSFPLVAGDFSFTILGGVSNDSSLIVVDSVTYVDTGKDIHYCMYGVDAPAPDPIPNPEEITPERTVEDSSTETTSEDTSDFTIETLTKTTLQPTLVLATNDEIEPESRTLALSLSIVFSIIFALVVGIACHCIQLRKERQLPRTRL